MTRCLFPALWVLLSGCADSDHTSHVPSEERIQAQPREAEVLSGQPFIASLASTPAGRDSVATQLAARRAWVLEVLDAAPPPHDVALATTLLVVARGEDKLTFASWLVIKGSRSAPVLMALLDTSIDLATTIQALQTLGKLGERKAIAVIKTRLGDREAWVRMASAHALGEIGGEGVVSALGELMSDSEAPVVAAAVIAIGKSGDPKGLPRVLDALGHTNPRVRGAAASAVGRLGSESHAERLRNLLKDPDDGVRYKASQALDQLAVD